MNENEVKRRFQIAEMEKDIDLGFDIAYKIQTSNFTNCIAETLVDKGYRKIPENGVVLTGMETEQRFEDLMVAFDEMGFMPNTTHPFPEEYVEAWKQRLIFVFGQLRKETAEKFAEMASKAFIGLNCIDIDEWNWCQRKIDEICKEISEGQDGNYKQDCRLDSKRKL